MKSVKHIFLFLTFFSFLFLSCKVEAEQINYGKDQCHFCSMNIVDKGHSAQYVTKKGKQFKFDAIECMVREVNEVSTDGIEILLVADFGDQGTMLDAKSSSYLISEAIQSPMGANLSALKSIESATSYQSEFQGEIYTWTELLEKFRK